MTSVNGLLTIAKSNWGGVKLPYQFTQLLKGLCCVMIALAHYPYQAADGTESLFYNMITTQGAHAGVALFFFLSGYGIMESEGKKHLNLWQFIIKRFWRIYKAVLIVNFLHYGSILCWGYFQEGFWSKIDVSLLFSITKLDFHFWFIKVLFSCYIGYAICAQIRCEKIKRIAFLLGQLVVFAFWCIKGEAIHHIVSIPLFCLGVYVSLYKEITGKIIRNVYTWVILVAATLAVFWWSSHLNDNMPIHTAANMLLIAGLLLLASIYEIKLGYQSFLGYISFPIYLVHWKIINLSSSLGHIAPIWLYIPLTLYLAWLLQKTIEISFFKKTVVT